MSLKYDSVSTGGGGRQRYTELAGMVVVGDVYLDLLAKVPYICIYIYVYIYIDR